MKIEGKLLVGNTWKAGTNGCIRAIEASSGEFIEPLFGGATFDDLDNACALAWSAFESFRETRLEARARFLDSIANNLGLLGNSLIERCAQETGLLPERIASERDRTIKQLRMFASIVREGDFLGVRIDPAMPERTPLPRPDLRMRYIPVGPVAVFGASNFPLAFSVAGGDTASALAAGCPVIVKAHSAHPGTSELVGHAVRQAVIDCDMPEGVFSLLYDSGLEIGQSLVADWRIKAVGFTGSRSGGTALMQIASVRREPIPVFAEMSSVNPVLLFPAALRHRGASIAREFVSSLVLGAGQFCTNPGLVLGISGPELDLFIREAGHLLSGTQAAVMLTPQILDAYQNAVHRLSAQPNVSCCGRGAEPDGNGRASASLFVTSAEEFLANPRLREEIFGATSLIVRCRDMKTMLNIVASLEGQLTAAVHIDAEDNGAAQQFLPTLELRAGRIIVNGFGTGVEVGHAMVHGGPYPSTSDGRSTSVGGVAISRFLRPVCYQNVPGSLLPEALQTGNPLGLNRRIDGSLLLRLTGLE